MSKSISIGTRKPDLVFLDKVESWSGKYFCFYGLHYVKGKTCYDVGSSNRETGEVVRRHYNEDNNFAPEASAKTFWEEFRQKMVQAPSEPEELSELEKIQQWLDIHEIVKGSA